LGEKKGKKRQSAISSIALFGLSLLPLAGCGSTGGSPINTSALDLFGTSSKATQADASADGTQLLPNTDLECPNVSIRNGAATLTIANAAKGAEPTALDVRYQGTIVRTARECHVNAGIMTIKVGIEGRVITGPAGGPGTVDIPLRTAVVQEGIEPKTVVTKFGRETVSVVNQIDRVSFTHIEPEISFPLPRPLGLIDDYVVYVGFDPLGAPQENKKPAGKRRAGKPKTAAIVR
jgi:hypothetical protein